MASLRGVRKCCTRGTLGVLVLVSGAPGVLAQDINNTSPFSLSAPYTGDVLSNSSTIYNGGPGGYWTGDVVANTSGITNGPTATWSGGVGSNRGSIDNYGTWINGDVTSNGDPLAVRSPASLGGNGAINNYGSWTGDINGNTDLIINYEDWFGDVTANLDAIHNVGTWTGSVAGNAGAPAQVINYTDATWIGDVTSNGNLVKNSGTWQGDVLGNSKNVWNATGRWEGDVLGNSSTVLNDLASTWAGDVISNGGLVVNRKGSTWIGDFTNGGTVRADNRIEGAFDNSGILQVAGALSGITILTNTGTIDMAYATTMDTLGAASASFGANAVYRLDINAAGGNDRIVLTGAAELGGVVQVVASTLVGTYSSPTDRYTILTAGSVDGEFSGATTDLAFFAAHLTYDASAVYLTLKRNDIGFSTAGVTANQIAVGTTVEDLGAGNPIYDAVLWLTQPETQQAFDDLSGEAYASAQSMALLDSDLVRNMALGRLRQVFGEVASGDDSISFYAGSASIDPGAPVEFGLWASPYGTYGRLDATADTAALNASTGGIVFGVDGVLDGWTLGVMLHAGYVATAVPELATQIEGQDFGLGVYGGQSWGDTRLAVGADYRRYDNHSTRNVDFPGFEDSLSADYGAGTAQAFAELSHEFDFDAVSLLPYINLAYVTHATDGFAETGGAAALTVTDSVLDATLATLGIRGEQTFVVADTMLLTANASLGWRRVFAGRAGGTHALADGDSFDIVGASIVEDVVVLGAGLGMDVNGSTRLDVIYDGLLGDGVETHALRAGLSVQF